MGHPARVWETPENAFSVKGFPQKKVLSLVLCLAVMLSVMVVGAGAAFSDQDKIENTEAVDACSALNIINGYEDSAFHPERNIKRAEVTKMICVALNGGEEPNTSTNAKPTFTDVRGTIYAWAEGYIESCVAQGIVDGVGGPRFAPAGNVTGAQLAKMLLVSLGYNATTEKFTGAAWETYVNVRASQKHLYDGLDKMDTSAPVTRDQAAQMIWNALQAYVVEYKDGVVQDKVVGETKDKITLLYDKYEAVVETGSITEAPSSNVNPKGIKFLPQGETDAINFRNATQDVSDLLGYEVKVVYKANKTDKKDAIYGIYKTENNKDYTATWKDIEKDGDKVKFDGKSYKLDGAIDVYADGQKLGAAWTSANFDEANLADRVTFIDSDGNGKIDAAQVKTVAVAKVGYIGSKNITTEALVGNQDFYGFTYENSPKLEDISLDKNIAADDYAVVTYDLYNDKVVYTKAELKTGKVDATRTENSTVQVRIDGEWYKCTAGYDYPTTMVAGDSVEFIAINNLLYHIKKVDGSWGSKSLAAIYAAGTYNVGVEKDKIEARLILRDGTKVKGIIASIDGVKPAGDGAVRDYIGQPMTYRINSDGEYELKSITVNNLAGYDAAVTWDSGATNLTRTTGEKNTALSTSAPISGDNLAGVELADDAVVFVVEKNAVNNTGDASDAKVFTGKQIKNLSSTIKGDLKPTKESAILRSTDNGYTYTMVAGLYATTMPASLTGASYGYLLSDAAETYVDKDGYRLYDLWTSEGKVQAREKNGDNYTYKAGTVLNFNIKSVGDDGVWTIEDVNYPVAPAAQVTSSNNGKKPGDTIGIDNAKYDITKDTVILFVDTENHVGTEFDKGVIMKADTNGVNNVRYLTLNGSNDLEFLLVDTTNKMQDAPQMTLGSAATAADINAALTSGDVVIDGDLSAAATIFVPAGRTLTISAQQTQTHTVTVDKDATLVIPNGTLLGTNGMLTASGDVTVKSASGGVQVESAADLTINGTLKMGTSDKITLTGTAKLLGRTGAVFQVKSASNVVITAGNFYDNEADGAVDPVDVATYNWKTFTVSGVNYTGWVKTV